MNLSKSKYCNGIQCKKMLWLDKYKNIEKQDISNQSVLDNGTEVGELAKKIFGEYIDIQFDSNLDNMIKDTDKALENKNCVITEASFNYDNNFCSVDLLKKENNNYEIYEVKSSTHVTEVYKNDISYQVYILTNLGYSVTKACIVHINSEYVRKGELELDKLFKIVDVTKEAFNRQEMVKNNIDEIKEYMVQKEEPKKDLSINCINPYPCLFFKYCSKHLPEKNVFDIAEMRTTKKFELYSKGLYKFEDLINEDINDKYKEQIEFELYDKEDKINVDNIHSFMNTLTYPLYFLDFESCQQTIPLYDGIKPYMQIPFQYSLHYVLDKEGEVYHKEFLSDAGIDPRRKLAEQLVNDIPKDTCVLAYNMSFEKSVIKNLAELYPDLSNHLLNIRENIKDLMIPFRNRDYYTKEMQGSYSIKYVLPALFPNEPSLNYHNLESVHNGSEASNTFLNLSKLSKDEQLKLRECLLKYCELDTYAMVKIWEKLKEI